MSDPIVLIADDDLFEADYVSAVLEARGLRVVRPIAEGAAAFGCDLRAAVIARGATHADRTGLVAELEQAGIPYLTLLRAVPHKAVTDRPTLAPPFAAYQVADWVMETVERQSGEPSAIG